MLLLAVVPMHSCKKLLCFIHKVMAVIGATAITLDDMTQIPDINIYVQLSANLFIGQSSQLFNRELI